MREPSEWSDAFSSSPPPPRYSATKIFMKEYVTILGNALSVPEMDEINMALLYLGQCGGH